jgi:FAD synthase
MAKRNVLTIRIPDDLKERLERVALIQGVSLNQFALYAFTKELAELETSKYFREVLKNKGKEEVVMGFEEVMGKVKKRKVEEWDKV